MLPQISIVRLTDTQTIPLPSYADGVGTCMTLRSNEAKSIKIAPQHFEIFSTGFAMALPIGMEAQIRSLKESNKTGLIVLNAPFTIDASDRAEIKVCLFNASPESIMVKQGDPIALMVFALALRVQWNDLTQQVVERIQEKQIQNENQILENKQNSDLKVVEENINNDNDTLSFENQTADLEKEESVPVPSDIISDVQDTVIQTEEKNIPPASEEENQPEKIETQPILEKEQSEKVNISAMLQENLSEEITNSFTKEESHTEKVDVPSILQQEKPTEEIEETAISEENPLIDEPVAPPAILEEFEKIENDFNMENPEDKSE